MKYYAIKADNFKKIVESWPECQEIIKTLKSPKFKSFSFKEEAEAFLEDKEYSDGVKGVKAYIDGSYDEKTNRYGFGGVLIIDGKEFKYKKGFDADEYSSLRNIAGEIKGAGFIINYCIKEGIKELHIFYDYLGIEKWYTGEWNANSSIAIKYQEFAKTAKEKINVIFHKVKSHTNNKYNDMADILAKESIGI